MTTAMTVPSRFLAARRWDVKKAEEMYAQHLAWREATFPVLRGEVLRELATRKLFLLPGRALDGSAVAVFHGPRHDPAEASLEETLRMVIYVIEYALSHPLPGEAAPPTQISLIMCGSSPSPLPAFSAHSIPVPSVSA